MRLLLAAVFSLLLATAALAQSTPANPRGAASLSALPASQNPPVANAYGNTPVALNNSDKATFTYVVTGLALTATSDALFIKAGPSMVTRVRSICILQPGLATAAVLITPTLVLRSTISSTCANANAAPGRVDSTQGAQYSGSVNSLCTVQGAATDTVWGWSVSVPATTAVAFTDPFKCVYFDQGQTKSVTVAPNTGVGLSWAGTAGGAGAMFSVTFTEEPL